MAAQALQPAQGRAQSSQPLTLPGYPLPVASPSLGSPSEGGGHSPGCLQVRMQAYKEMEMSSSLWAPGYCGAREIELRALPSGPSQGVGTTRQ